MKKAIQFDDAENLAVPFWPLRDRGPGEIEQFFRQITKN
jgi:hypothetical protein